MADTKWSTYTFMFKGSGQIVAAITATSYHQAMFKLKLKKGASWTNDALETGRVYLGSSKEAEAPITKAAIKKQRKERFEQLQEAGGDWWND